MKEVIVTMNHVRSAGMCARESRNWCRARGLDWNEFITNGFPAHVLLDTNDSLVNPVVQIAINDPNAKWVDVN